MCGFRFSKEDIEISIASAGITFELPESASSRLSRIPFRDIEASSKQIR